MTEESKEVEPDFTGQGPFPMRPGDVASCRHYLRNGHKGARTPRPNRTDLLNHLQAIFNEAREDRRSYRALRAVFSTAVGVATMLQNNIFNNIQSTSEGFTALLMLLALAITSFKTNLVIHDRIPTALSS